jgi:hypothetical protein
MLDPSRWSPKTETLEPNRENARILNDEPRMTWSKADNDVPHRNIPYNESELPNLIKLRTE